KAANAGGVAVSGLEMSQNSERIAWNHAKLHDMLTGLMRDIHDKCAEFGRDQNGSDPYVDYVKGANIAGFKKVADAMLAFGVV
ncbi:MAG: glutamate dehydrogenase, partial [Pseudomonadota bacterium]